MQEREWFRRGQILHTRTDVHGLHVHTYACATPGCPDTRWDYCGLTACAKASGPDEGEHVHYYDRLVRNTYVEQERLGLVECRCGDGRIEKIYG